MKNFVLYCIWDWYETNAYVSFEDNVILFKTEHSLDGGISVILNMDMMIISEICIVIPKKN